jgi:hypothetical protein
MKTKKKRGKMVNLFDTIVQLTMLSYVMRRLNGPRVGRWQKRPPKLKKMQSAWMWWIGRGGEPCKVPVLQQLTSVLPNTLWWSIPVDLPVPPPLPDKKLWPKRGRR